MLTPEQQAAIDALRSGVSLLTELGIAEGESAYVPLLAAVDALMQENAALRAQLAATPPTLEWAKSTIGEPSESNSRGAIWRKHGILCLSGQFSAGGYFLSTRAAVLAAVQVATNPSGET